MRRLDTRPDPRNALPLRIETERLVLRPPMRADVPALVALADNRRIAAMLTRLPSPYTRADAIGFVEIVAQRADERIYALTGRDLTFMGCIGIHFFPGAAPELGYWLGEPFWGRGYATEAVRALVAAAFATGQFPVLKAFALAANPGSARVLEKSGFVPILGEPEQQDRFGGRPYRGYVMEPSP